MCLDKFSHSGDQGTCPIKPGQWGGGGLAWELGNHKVADYEKMREVCVCLYSWMHYYVNLLVLKSLKSLNPCEIACYRRWIEMIFCCLGHFNPSRFYSNLFRIRYVAHPGRRGVTRRVGSVGLSQSAPQVVNQYMVYCTRVRAPVRSLARYTSGHLIARFPATWIFPFLYVL